MVNAVATSSEGISDANIIVLVCIAVAHSLSESRSEFLHCLEWGALYLLVAKQYIEYNLVFPFFSLLFLLRKCVLLCNHYLYSYRFMFHFFPLVSSMNRFHQCIPFSLEVKYQQRCWWRSHLPSQWNARCSSASPAPSGLEQGWGWVRSHSLDLQWYDRAHSLTGTRQLSVNSLSHVQHMLCLGLCSKSAVCSCYFDGATDTLFSEVVT